MFSVVKTTLEESEPKIPNTSNILIIILLIEGKEINSKILSEDKLIICCKTLLPTNVFVTGFRHKQFHDWFYLPQVVTSYNCC
jgi:hypothetical protein